MTTTPQESIARMACHGADTTIVRAHGEHFERCKHCEMMVRHDMVDHGFFGFRAGCKHAADARGQGREG